MRRIITCIIAALGLLISPRAAAFSITLDIDNPQAVSITADGEEITPTEGEIAVTADYVVEVGVNEGFAFTSFLDGRGGDWLQYPEQTAPVIIREYIATGESESLCNDGLTFRIKTRNLDDNRNIPLTVTVDNAAKVKMKIGPSADIYSGRNRTVDLSDGENNLRYSADDKYLLVAHTDLWTPLAKVVFNGDEISYDYSFTYVCRLGEEGATLEITVNDEGINPDEPVEPEPLCTFTLSIDDLSKLRYFTLEGNPETELLDTLTEGENSIEFTEGSTFSIWPKAEYTPESITLDGEEIAPREGINVYYFTPFDGSVVDVRFNRGSSDEQYTVKVTFVNSDTRGFVQFAQVNDVDVSLSEFIDGKVVNHGDEVWFSYRRFDYIINDITVNGISKGPKFTGAVLFNVYEDTEVVFDVERPVALHYTIDVDDADNVVAYTGVDPENEDKVIKLTTGKNNLEILNLDPTVRIFAVPNSNIYRIDDNLDNLYTPDADGVYTISISEGLELTVVTLSDSVALSETEDCGTVYNLQGIPVMEHATAKSVRNLPAGIYILGGKKIIVK